jgi:TatD DNase family protein
VIDTHCHLDQYPDPVAIAEAAARRGVAIVAVTSLPSHFLAGQAPVKRLPRTRLALGLHPLLSEQHQAELGLFARLLGVTSYVGEVGLDFSRHGRASRDAQVRSFRFVLGRLSEQPRFVSLHSRGAEQAVFDLLGEHGVGPAVFHWYSGSVALAAAITAAHHFFSVNPAMLASGRGRELLESLPRTAVLTETDGPYVRVGNRPAVPDDVLEVGRGLSRLWKITEEATRDQLRANFRAAVAHLSTDRKPL